jgi:hypothetical protein
MNAMHSIFMCTALAFNNLRTSRENTFSRITRFLMGEKFNFETSRVGKCMVEKNWSHFIFTHGVFHSSAMKMYRLQR